MEIKGEVDKVLLALAKYKPYVVRVMMNGRIWFLRFENVPEDKCPGMRISDLPESGQYNCKWQLILTGTEEEQKNKHSRYFATAEELIEDFISYYEAVDMKRQGFVVPEVDF